MVDMSKWGAQMIALRQQQGFTQEELGDRLGVSAQAVSKWERGLSLPDTAILPDIARILKTSVDTMLETETDAAAPATENQNQLLLADLAQGDYGPFMRKAGAFDEILLCFGIDLFRFDGIRTAFDRLLEGLALLRTHVYRETGVILPVMRVRDESKPPIGDDTVIFFRGKPVWRETFDPARDYQEDRAYWEQQMAGPVPNPSDGAASPAADPNACEPPVVFWAYHVLQALHEAVHAQLTSFNTVDHVARVIKAVRGHYPVLVDAVVPTMYSLPMLREVYNGVLSEQISIRDQLTLLESLLAFGTQHPDGSPEEAAAFIKARIC